MDGEEASPAKSTGGRVKRFVSCNGYPIAVFLILVNEFCERFSFYGMRTVLTLYLKNKLGLGRGVATEIFHGFNVLCYFTPLLGAVLADGYIGKYRTIMYLSLVYAVGNVVMSLTAIPPSNIAGPIVGLLLIGLGTGGIKPCVSAFGGDQFAADQTTKVARFFSIFYFAINAGSFFSTFVTPILREDVQCFGGDCYVAAFGLPAILMLVAILVFVCGKNLYKINPPGGNVIGQFVCSIASAVSNKWRKRGVESKKESSFIYHASERYERGFLCDVEAILGVLLMFLPLPLFWALYDQQGSTWTLQAEQMDGDIGFITIKPDQMQAINTVFIILFIPLFEAVIYPLLNKCRIPNRPLQRMTVGMILAAASFVMAGFVQLSIESHERPVVEAGEMRLRFVNTLPCDVQLTGPLSDQLLSSQASTEFQLTSLEKGGNVHAMSTCNGNELETTFRVTLHTQNDSSVYLTWLDDQFRAHQIDGLIQKPTEGDAQVRILSLLNHNSINRQNICLTSTEMTTRTKVFSDVITDQMTAYKTIVPGSYHVSIAFGNGSTHVKVKTSVLLRQRGGFTLVLTSDIASSHQIHHVTTYEDVTPNIVPMLLQIPQYVVITAGEILFSITGLSFAYSEAPASMKSVLQAFWLLTMAVGNLLVMIFVTIQVSNSMAVEMFVYSGLLAVDVIVFCILSFFYTYKSVTPGPNGNQIQPTPDVSEDGLAMETVATNETTDVGDSEPKPSTSQEIH